MRKVIFCFFSFAVSFQVSSQSGIALKYFNKGLKYFQEGKYILADSLFRSSINIEPSTNAYYNLALVKNKLKDSIGCCDNLKKAADLGDLESYKLYESYCSLSNKYYVLGVKEFKNNDLLAADSLFQLSLQLEKKANTYYNLAITKLREGDSCAYCTYLKYAYEYGDMGSKKYYKEYCCNIDTIKIKNSDLEEYKIVNLVTVSKCLDDRICEFIRYSDKDTVFRYSISDIKKGIIRDIDVKNISGDSVELTLHIDTNERITGDEGKCYLKKVKTKREDPIFVIVEQMPSYQGGEEKMYEFMAGELTYPQVAKEKGIEGKVIITFIIEKDGSISDVFILKDIGGGCGEEAARLVRSMPKWKPGMQGGVPVRVQFNLPLVFSLE